MVRALCIKALSMDFSCPSCHKKYSIPDRLLPKVNKPVKIPCKVCRTPIILHLGDSSGQTDPPENRVRQKEPPQPPPAPPKPKPLLSGPELKQKIIDGLDDLPALPQVVIHARETMTNPKAGMKQLAQVLSTDQSLTAKVLRMANSAYYGLRGRVASVRHAAILLGNQRLAEVITMAGSARLLDRELTGYEMAPKILWRHSMAVAFGARWLVMKKNPDLENDAFVSGLIHDVGKIILDKYLAERMRAFRKRLASARVLDFTRVEQEILGFDHTSIAFQACRKWGLPEQLGEAVRHHHHPSRSGQPQLAAAVHLGDAMALMSGIATGMDGLMFGIESEALEILEVTQQDFLDIMADTVEAVDKVEARTLGAG